MNRSAKGILFTSMCAVPAIVISAPASASEARIASDLHASTSPQTAATHTSSVAGGQPSVQVTAGQQDKRAVITVASSFDNGVQWQAKISSPWDSDSSGGDLATLDGLGRGFKAELGLNYLFFSPPSHRALDLKLLDEACDSARKSVGRMELECDDRLYEMVTDPEILGRLTQAYFGGRSKIPSIYASISTSRDDFAFFDEDLSRRSEHRSGWGVAAGVSVLDPVQGWAIYADYQRQRAYGDSTDSQATLCTPIDDSPAERCVTSFLQPPVAKYKNIFSFEYRRQHSAAVALSARVAYDKNEDVIGVSVPIYLFTNSSSGLSGGLRFGWNDRDRDLIAAVFVSAGFTLRK